MKYPRQIDYEPGTLITIDDVFGFYQSPFVNVVESLVQGGHANEAEYGSKRSSGWADALSVVAAVSAADSGAVEAFCARLR